MEENNDPTYVHSKQWAEENGLAVEITNRVYEHLTKEQTKEQESRKPKPPVKIYRVGRNDNCPCQSGKKFKRCCMPRIKAITQDSQDKLRAIQEATAAENQPEQDKIDKATPVNLRNPTARNLRRAIKKMNRKQ